jgi:AcrR family transcriptional regulator
VSRIAAEQRRVLLVEAALRVIAREGVSAATTRAIVAEAGMALASFHYAFPSRDALMRELVSHVVGAEAVSAFAALRPGDDIEESLRAGLTAYLQYVTADPDHELAMQELVQYALRTPGLDHLAREQYDIYRSVAVELLTEGAAAAGVEWRQPIDEVARLLIVQLDGITLAWLVDRDAAAATRAIDFAARSLAALAEPVRRAAHPEPLTNGARR